jgi:ATP-dependent DNA ligase
MLASPYKGEPEFPVYAQPKLDGYRMLYDARTGVAWSRTGHELSVPHILKELKAIKCGSCILDGELYLHGRRFQDIQRMVNSESAELEFWVFDMVLGEEGGEQFTERYSELVRVFKRVPAAKRAHVRLVPTTLVHTAAGVDALHDKMLHKGFEGLVLRTPSAPYVPRRSTHLIKVKRFMDAEFAVTGFKARKDGVGIVWQCATGEGAKFWVNDPHGPPPASASSKAKRRVGAYLTVKFQDTFHTGIPRFPVAKGFRDAADFSP